MKKKSIKNLTLNKKVISNLNPGKIKGGDMPVSDPNTYKCNTADQCETIDPLPQGTCNTSGVACGQNDTEYYCDTINPC